MKLTEYTQPQTKKSTDGLKAETFRHAGLQVVLFSFPEQETETKHDQ